MDYKDLFDRDAVAKLQELARNAETGFLQTHLDHIPCSGRPMIIAKVDDEGRMWFFSKASSHKNSEIAINNRVQVICARPHCSEFLNLFGEAFIMKDEDKIRELWRPSFKLWFEGIHDPDISLICVKPAEAYYWDSKHNTAAMLFKNVFGALTGVAMNGDVHGALKVDEQV